LINDLFDRNPRRPARARTVSLAPCARPFIIPFIYATGTGPVEPDCHPLAAPLEGWSERTADYLFYARH
jgi:hypothetical protein